MIVPNIDYLVFVDVTAGSDCGDLHGYVGSEVEREPDDKPRRPIGFRLPEREEPREPGWMLL